MTMSLIALAQEMKSSGRSVVPMVAGEPDFPTPSNICLAGIGAIVTGDTKYGSAVGTPALRKEIARKFLEDNQLEFSPSQVIVATGTKPLFFSAFMTICDHGTEVIVPSPYWVSYPSIVHLAGANVIDLPCFEENGFKIDPSALRAAITPNTRALLLNSPGNPTGAVYTKEEMIGILDVLRENPSVFLVTDEIYEHLIYDNQQHWSAGSLAPDLIDRIIVINGFSKGYGMIGWRLGFAAGPQQVITAMGDFLSHILGAPSTITQAAALAALRDPKPYLKINREDYSMRRECTVNLINSIPGLSCGKPAGAFFIFVNCQALFGKTTAKGSVIKDDGDLCKVAIEEAGVALVPGSAFGAPGYFRLSYSTSMEDIKAGLGRLRNLCETLS
ncbi:aspartate aminotransferase, putative [Ricinus communis]|uniref:Bifunctional aspartate aminotransferase and glutamate/aspartate-prephenate aminotransferase n=1 Tax=Ricinus communis TaxID=3988 RepID=B9T9V4_RICCO|nr:aspartate aminotransferase, putative [Ricinus communis]